jgi:hypothetical protein
VVTGEPAITPSWSAGSLVPLRSSRPRNLNRIVTLPSAMPSSSVDCRMLRTVLATKAPPKAFLAQ